MEMQGRGKQFYADAGDGAMANFNFELQQLKKANRRCNRILGALLLLAFLTLLALIIVVAVQSTRIHHLTQREGLIPHQNVTFASQSGNHSVDGLTYGGSLFRGSGFWSSRYPLPHDLTDHAAIAINNETQVVIIGGAGVNGTAVNETWLYDPVYHTYTALAPMPGPRYRFGDALVNNKIYIFGGRVNDNGPNGSVNATYIYDIATNVWSIGADILEPGSGSDQCGASIGEFVYMFGGYDPNYLGYLNSNQIYDPVTNVWKQGPDMPTPRGDLMCTGFPYDGQLYAIGGYVNAAATNQNSFTPAVEAYNPNTSTWTEMPPLLTPRGDGAVTVLPGDRLMVVGGEGHYDNNQTLKYPKHVNEIYYGQDFTWVEKAMIPTARFRTAVATALGLAYVFGGADVCPDLSVCPALNVTEFYLDVDHPHVYIYLKNEAYNDNAALITYPV